MLKIMIYLILYFALPPGILYGIRTAKNRVIFAMSRDKKRAQMNMATQEDFIIKLRKRINFTKNDPRSNPIPYKLIFFTIYGAGAVFALMGGMFNKLPLLILSIIIAYMAAIFSAITADPIVKKRDVVLSRILEIKSSKMRNVNTERGAIVTPQTEFKILEWGEDLISPVRIHFYMPTTFSSVEVGGFLESFNLIFGGNGAWVANPQDEQYPGFDFSEGVASLIVTPPLPTLAMWHERYLNPKDVHWSFFPMALGAENGIPVYNEETGETEHVLGFSVNSGQTKFSSKKGVQIGPEVVGSPQSLISGGTGGGKSVATDTPVQIVVKS